MVKYIISASLVFIQLAMVAQTSFGLPVNSKDGLESRSIYDRDIQRLDQRDLPDLSKRAPMLGAALLGAAGTMAFINHEDNKNNRRGLYDVNLDERNSNDDFEKRNWEDDFEKRDWDDELEERNWEDDFEKRDWDDELEERNWEDEFEKRDWDDELEKRNWEGDFEERDWDDELEKRNWEGDFEERDWDDELEKRNWEDDFEKRDWDDYELEARDYFDELDELD